MFFYFCFVVVLILWIICVSLGGHCTVAQQIQHLKLNNAYYPFDWILSRDMNSVLDILENRFVHFMMPDI